MTDSQLAHDSAQESAQQQTPGNKEKHIDDVPGRRYPAGPVVGVATAVFRPDSQLSQPRTSTDTRQPSDPSDPTVSGAISTGAILLVKRKYPPRAGEWGLPGGRLHLGEQTLTGAARELWEECGITAEIGGIVDTFEPIIYDATGRVEYHYVVIEFWAHYTGGAAQAGDDAAEVCWIAVEDLLALDLRADTQRIIEKAHRAWQKSMLVKP